MKADKDLGIGLSSGEGGELGSGVRSCLSIFLPSRRSRRGYGED